MENTLKSHSTYLNNHCSACQRNFVFSRRNFVVCQRNFNELSFLTTHNKLMCVKNYSLKLFKNVVNLETGMKWKNSLITNIFYLYFDAALEWIWEHESKYWHTDIQLQNRKDFIHRVIFLYKQVFLCSDFLFVFSFLTHFQSVSRLSHRGQRSEARKPFSSLTVQVGIQCRVRKENGWMDVWFMLL